MSRPFRQPFIETYGEVPPEYLPDALEVPEPARVFEPGRSPGIAQDLAGDQALRPTQSDEPVEIDMTIGLGEDPGWRRIRQVRQWRGPSRASRHQQT